MARRIRGPISDNDRVTLTGNTRPRLASAGDLGLLDNAQVLPRLTLRFALTSQGSEDLAQLLRLQQDPNSSSYHKFLTPEQFGERFGPASADLQAVSAWLAAQGFEDIQLARSHAFLSFSGTAGQASSVFHTSLHRFRADGEDHFANVSDPQIPAVMKGLVASIGGLHDFKYHPHGISRLNAHWTSDITGSHFLAPADFAVIYNLLPLYQAGLDGKGVRIAVAGQSNIQLNDIRAFRAAAGLGANDPAVILAGPDPGVKTASGDEMEADLDVEWAGAIAPNASIFLVTAPDVDTSINYAIDQNVAPILSLSYGACENRMSQAEYNSSAVLYQQANAQGITVIGASGDGGAADCDTAAPVRSGLSVDSPSNFPSVTSIGGTTLADSGSTYWNATNSSVGGSALSYIPETVWNDSSGTSLSSGGGGKSRLTPKPAWQVAPGVPADGARDVPDVSLVASPNHDGLLVCSNGSCVNGYRQANSNLTIVGGTSAGSPAFAAIVALLVETLGPQGNINPQLYALARTVPAAFHDITTGTNAVSCAANTPDCPATTVGTTATLGYTSGVGYDLASGLGSPDAYQLVSQWSSAAAAATGVVGGPYTFVPLTPCRVVDTRYSTGAFGSPELAGGATREFALPAGACGIPATAAAYALNVTVVPDGKLNFLSLWPGGQGRPLVSTLNSDGRIKATSAIVPAGLNGSINVFATEPTHVILDVSGYFVPAASASGLQFYPLVPCRILDTRTLGSTYLVAGQPRAFPMVQSGCPVPATAQAYSLNFTAVPHRSLFYLTAYPAGQALPLASILNALPGTTTANAAIVPAGTNGEVAVYASDDTDLVIDTNGYFAPVNGGDYLYTLSPCRLLDTRNPAGALPFTGTIAANLGAAGCGAPPSAQAYALTATVVPAGALRYLTLWPPPLGQPTVSTLNADANTNTSNMAIVPNLTGTINAYASDSTYLILDIAGYFGP